MLLEKIEKNPENIQFAEVINYIDENFDFVPTKFQNGNTLNEVNQNNGSCKIFFFAKSLNLPKEKVLQLFGDFYRIEVLNHPEGNNHQNIRNFMISGWEGIQFEQEALKKK